MANDANPGAAVVRRQSINRRLYDNYCDAEPKRRKKERCYIHIKLLNISGAQKAKRQANVSTKSSSSPASCTKSRTILSYIRYWKKLELTASSSFKPQLLLHTQTELVLELQSSFYIGIGKLLQLSGKFSDLQLIAVMSSVDNADVFRRTSIIMFSNFDVNIENSAIYSTNQSMKARDAQSSSGYPDRCLRCDGRPSTPALCNAEQC